MDDAIDAIHFALSALTGSPVIGVFQTLSAGKAGQAVPGSVGPDVATCAVVGCSTGDVVDAAPLAVASSDEMTTTEAVTPRRRRPLARAAVVGVMVMFYNAVGFPSCGLSKCCVPGGDAVGRGPRWTALVKLSSWKTGLRVGTVGHRGTLGALRGGTNETNRAPEL